MEFYVPDHTEVEFCQYFFSLMENTGKALFSQFATFISLELYNFITYKVSEKSIVFKFQSKPLTLSMILSIFSLVESVFSASTWTLKILATYLCQSGALFQWTSLPNRGIQQCSYEAEQDI